MTEKDKVINVEDTKKALLEANEKIKSIPKPFVSLLEKLDELKKQIVNDYPYEDSVVLCQRIDELCVVDCIKEFKKDISKADKCKQCKRGFEDEKCVCRMCIDNAIDKRFFGDA